MKKVLSLMFVVTLCAILAGCNSAVSECEDAINAIGTLDSAYSASDGEYEIDFAGMERFEKADELFNQLSENQQKKVGNSNLLEEQRETYEALAKVLPDLIMYSRIYARVEMEAEMEAKFSCDNPSSFKLIRIDNFMDNHFDDYIDRTTGEFSVKCTVWYTETNSYGGPKDGDIFVEITGIYDFEEQTVMTCESKILPT